jgi:hypothetical protein
MAVLHAISDHVRLSNIQLSGAHHLPHSAVSRLTAPAHLRQCEHKNGSLCLVDSAAALIGWRLELL